MRNISDIVQCYLSLIGPVLVQIRMVFEVDYQKFRNVHVSGLSTLLKSELVSFDEYLLASKLVSFELNFFGKNFHRLSINAAIYITM